MQDSKHALCNQVQLGATWRNIVAAEQKCNNVVYVLSDVHLSVRTLLHIEFDLSLLAKFTKNTASLQNLISRTAFLDHKYTDDKQP